MVLEGLFRRNQHFHSHFIGKHQSYEKCNRIGNYNLFTRERDREHHLEEKYNLIS